ncbi:hypothetical protein [Ruminococcus sp.]|uniref:hypothetical protein n=1 Tax=Ruminococcus sp. TaxID=41978 RepID=UPI003AB27F80
MLLKLAAGCVVIMTFIVIACLITPKIARFIEKRHPEFAEKDDPERVDGENTGNDPENYKVQGIFDKSHIDGWDPNYKIYNEEHVRSHGLFLQCQSFRFRPGCFQGCFRLGLA